MSHDFPNIVILVIASHPENAYSPMTVTLSGIVISGSFAQPANANPPILFTPLPMDTLVRFLQ